MTRMKEVLVGAAGSLLGVLLGGALIYVTTRRAQVSKALLDARIATFADFAAALMEYRRALMERWHVENGSPPRGNSNAGVYECRSAAWAALYKVQLLAGSPALAGLAQEAVDATATIKRATDAHDVAVRANRSRDKVSAFISASRDDVAAYMRVL